MFHSSIRSLLCLCSLMIAGARQVWLLHAKILSRVPMVFSGRGVPGKISLVYLAVLAAAWQWGGLPGDKLPGTAFADPVVHVLSGPGDHETFSNDGQVHLVYGTAGNNRVMVEPGAKVHLRHFPGANKIIIFTYSTQCVASRSGAMVTIEDSSDGTLVKIPATAEKQYLEFTDASKALQIIGGQVNLSGLTIGLNPQSFDQDLLPPEVSVTYPAHGADGVVTDTSIRIYFSDLMKFATLIPDNFALEKIHLGGYTPVPFTLAKDGFSAILIPDERLARGQLYKVKVKTGVQDEAGNPLAEEKVITFTTTTIPPFSHETIPPVVQSTIPANGDTDVDVDNPITIVFSEQMALHTLIPENFALGERRKAGPTYYYEPVPFTLTLGPLGTSATLTPNEPLAYHKKHRLKVKTGVQDKVGNPMAEEHVITFTTGGDTKPPVVVSATPADGAEGVGVNSPITIHFNEPMNQDTFSPFISLAKKWRDGGNVFVSIDSSKYTLTKTPTSVTLTPREPLFYDTTYRLTVSRFIEDISGNRLKDEKTITFTTAKPQPGDEMTIDFGNGVGMTFVWVPRGSFHMGSFGDDPNASPDEMPRHLVTLTQGFWMGKYEVTQEQWLHIMGYNPSHFQGYNLPVENVSWNMAHEFIDELPSKTLFHRFFLPTEAQWEYAARGGVPGHIYSGGNDPNPP